MPYQVIYQDVEGHIITCNIAGRKALDAFLYKLGDEGSTILTIRREGPYGQFIAA